MIRGVIFDADGVLLNSMPVWENLGELYLEHKGICAEKGLGEILFPMSMEEAASYLISNYGLEISCSQAVKELAAEIREFYVRRVPLKEGVRDFLEKLWKKNLPVTIATSGDRENLEAALKRLKVYSHFQGIFTCSEIGSGKDRPDVYLAAALHMDTDPQETLVFEDAYHALCTARAAGFRTAAVYDRASGRYTAEIKKKADIYIRDFSHMEYIWKQIKCI